MAIITKKKILEYIKKGEIVFKPDLDSFQIQAHTVDLRLGYTFLIPKIWKHTERGREALHIDHFDKDKSQYLDALELEKGQFFDLLPGEHVLVSTLESIKVPDDLMAILYPRSSTNRKGLSVDLTGIIDSGYEGQLAVPIKNNTHSQTVRLYPGERFCQIVFEKLDEKVEIVKSRYHKKDIIEGFIRRKETQSEEEEEEIELIQKGNIEELKEKYKLQ
ncbi:MAG: dCTP deaminase [Patescibacteria group bacterium]|nr:dCTP deaminase [Patescibacteria group bacterium]